LIQTIRSTQGMAVATHALASQSALAVLRDGGNAIEAMVAAAATISIAYPHMNGIGGDAFWLIVPQQGAPVAIDAAGPAAARATIAAYAEAGHDTIPTRGPLAMNTVAGAIGSWDAALHVSKEHGGQLPLARLLRDAIQYANDGIAVTASQVHSTTNKFSEVAHQPGFAERFLVNGEIPEVGALFRQPKLAKFMEQLAADGLDSFYRGALAEKIAEDFKSVGALLSINDLNEFRPRVCQPLQIELEEGTVYNMVPPTQGVISLAILGILERSGIRKVRPDSADHIHLCVEATKQAFKLRDAYVTDPAYMTVATESLLHPSQLDVLAKEISLPTALPWGGVSKTGDTIWMGVIDSNGLAVSFIQSIYHEFGSGVVLPTTGLNWQNRGASFSLDPKHLQALRPRKKPFHTLNPAAARLNDGRSMVYGTMGGDGQPQTQAAVFSRAIWFKQPLQQAVSAPRWLLGRTWGQTSDTLKLESRIPETTVHDLRQRGHDIELLGAYDETTGHAGAIIRYGNGVLEGAADPRSDGCVAGY
jgi:gamma-glutamyltranspeptidase/glutathione hydrolase